MGLEIKNCPAHLNATDYVGHLHLDSNQLEFKSPEITWTVKLGKGTYAKVLDDGKLKVNRGSKAAWFEVGEKAEKWQNKIVNPPTRATKLGLKPGHRYVTLGTSDEKLSQELDDVGLTKAPLNKSELAFVFMSEEADLKLFQRAATLGNIGLHIWAIWPKGIEAIKQAQVIAFAKKFGMGPGKGIAFDDRCSAMRFTLRN